MCKIRLVALDLDGTLFDNSSRISARNIKTIRTAIEKGVHVIISTGRPFAGLPFEQLKDTGIRYAITANGSAIYEIPTQKCLAEEAMDEKIILPVLDFLLSRDIHMDAFIGGKGYTPVQCVPAGQKLTVPDSLKHYILNTRIRVDNLPGFIQKNQLKVQKMTLNFYPDENGVYKNREEVRQFLESNPMVSCVSGGYNNLEFTRADVSKGTALYTISDLLHVKRSETMAIGDTENDLEIINAAGTGIAMGNATDDVKQQADYVTADNMHDGVADAIEQFVLNK